MYNDMPANTPKVSVVIPIYKVEKYIERCARSLFEQSLNEMEYIFVNDATPDKSMERLYQVIQEYPARSSQIKIVEHERNRGLAKTRNDGMQYATGIYIIHCDSDDWVESDMYERLYQKAIEVDADIVISDFFIDFKTKSVVGRQPLLQNKEEVIGGLLDGTLHGNVWAKLVKRSLYLDNGISFPEGISMWEDLLTMFKLAMNSQRIAMINVPLYHYIQYNENSLISTYNSDRVEDSLIVCQRIEQILKEREEYQYYYHELMFLIYRTTKVLVFNRKFRNYKRWMELWPESHQENPKYRIPWNQRKVFDLIERKNYVLATLIIDIKQLIQHFVPSSRV